MNLSIPYFFTYQKNHKATEPFKRIVIDMDIIKNFFPTPLFVDLILFIDEFSLIIYLIKKPLNLKIYY